MCFSFVYYKIHLDVMLKSIHENINMSLSGWWKTFHNAKSVLTYDLISEENEACCRVVVLALWPMLFFTISLSKPLTSQSHFHKPLDLTVFLVTVLPQMRHYEYLFITIWGDARQNPIVQIMQLNWREALKKKKKEHQT